jgi:hypothetical protein
MITLRTQLAVPGVTGTEVTDFFLNCTDAEYQRWWPGTHLSYHTINRVPGDVGSLVVMDEYIGDRRVRAKGVVTEVEPGKRIAPDAHGRSWLSGNRPSLGSADSAVFFRAFREGLG